MLNKSPFHYNPEVFTPMADFRKNNIQLKPLKLIIWKIR